MCVCALFFHVKEACRVRTISSFVILKDIYIYIYIYVYIYVYNGIYKYKSSLFLVFAAALVSISFLVQLEDDSIKDSLNLPCKFVFWILKNLACPEEEQRTGMNELNGGRSRAWNIYSSSNGPSQTDFVNKEAPWKSFGSSMNAISFGFVATAILISMFLIMAIFEHLFRPNASHDESTGVQSRQMHKLRDQEIQVQTSYASDFSVVMPGEQYPTFIAQPAPLPCPREGVSWPPHQHIV